jgi:hypothetical protein
MHALSVTYGLTGSTTAQYAEFCRQLAPAFSVVPGLLSKTWLANSTTGRYGAFYVFASRAAFDAFVASELYGTSVSHPAVRDVVAGDFAVELVTSGEEIEYAH